MTHPTVNCFRDKIGELVLDREEWQQIATKHQFQAGCKVFVKM
jgi:hypothetical protein